MRTKQPEKLQGTLKFYEAFKVNKGRDMSEQKTLNIYQRINKVMQEVKYAQKDANVQGYKAVTHDQVVATARQSFVKHGVVIVPDQQSGQFDEPVNGSKMRLYTGAYIISFVNMDNPEDRVAVTIEAHALDNGDKAPGKCLTYATKSAVLKVLWLETGENDESRAKDTETISQDQVNSLLDLASQSGMTEDDVCRMAKVQFIGEILASSFPVIKSGLERMASQPKESITDDRLKKAIERINAGEFTLAKLHAKFELTDEQKSMLEGAIK